MLWSLNNRTATGAKCTRLEFSIYIWMVIDRKVRGGGRYYVDPLGPMAMWNMDQEKKEIRVYRIQCYYNTRAGVPFLQPNDNTKAYIYSTLQLFALYGPKRYLVQMLRIEQVWSLYQTRNYFFVLSHTADAMVGRSIKCVGNNTEAIQ